LKPAGINASNISQIEASHAEKSPETESAPTPYITGHGNQRLASFMDSHPEVGIFKRFGDLNVFNLLALQSELAYLPGEFLDELAREDVELKKDGQPSMDCNIRKFGQYDSARWDILMHIRSKLYEYSRL
jgi:hypothetical protein